MTEKQRLVKETREVAKSEYAAFLARRSTAALAALVLLEAGLFALLSVDGIGLACGLIGDDVLQWLIAVSATPIMAELLRRFRSPATSS